MKNYLQLIVFLTFSVTAFPQNWQKIDSVFSPIGISVKSFSCPHLSDLNNDGKPDLLLGTSDGNTEFYYNVSTPQVPHFSLDTNIMSPIYINGLVGTNSDYPTTADLNGDGLLDLFIGGFNGVLYYKNTGSKTLPVFQKDNSVFSTINLEIGTDAKPAFGDLDGDGDLDLIIGIGESLFGGPEAGLTFGYRNIGTKLAPAFKPDSTLVLGIQNMGYNSYPAIADLDGDGDLDLLFGRDKATFIYYQNKGTVSAPVWILNSNVFASTEQSSFWKNPTLSDLDSDGDYDLIYGTSSGQMYYYQNNGTKTSPQFVQNTTFFSVIKVAGASTVSFADFDVNGSTDFISGSQLGGFQYFYNSGTRNQPVFSVKTMPFSSFKPGIYSTPVFVDINNDGQKDIVAGALSGKLYCYINNNGTFTENTTLLSSINVNGFSVPTFGDLNDDGKIDLLVGAENWTNVKFYLNNSNNSFIQNDLLLADVVFSNNSKPVFSDIDGDGDLDLIIGQSSGSIVFYENTGTKTKPVWNLNNSIFSGIKVKQNASPGFADLDGDGRKDMIIGEYNGNLTYFKNLFANPTSVKNEPLPYLSDFYLGQNYPNPFNPSTLIRFSVPYSSFVSLKLYDVLGNEVKTLVNEIKNAGSYEVTLNASNLSSGVYFYSLKAGNHTITKKLQLIK